MIYIHELSLVGSQSLPISSEVWNSGSKGSVHVRCTNPPTTTSPPTTPTPPTTMPKGKTSTLHPGHKILQFE